MWIGSKPEADALLREMVELKITYMMEAQGKERFAEEAMYYGMACGIIDSMRVTEMITWEEACQMKAKVNLAFRQVRQE